MPLPGDELSFALGKDTRDEVIRDLMAWCLMCLEISFLFMVFHLGVCQDMPRCNFGSCSSCCIPLMELSNFEITRHFACVSPDKHCFMFPLYFWGFHRSYGSIWKGSAVEQDGATRRKLVLLAQFADAYRHIQTVPAVGEMAAIQCPSPGKSQWMHPGICRNTKGEGNYSWEAN